MWLLNTATRKLTYFSSDPPQYAILSHTWGEEEVTFSDITDRSDFSEIISKQGYVKISGFCEEAASHGFKWVWVDTCCIDKTSSADLSEAINSMFAWYRGAVVCYVYLSDFVTSSDSDFAFRGRDCRWFTRGWTLQELLAPENVAFYDQSWKEFGTKRSLAPIISEITGIDQELLVGQSTIAQYSIAQRMSWAASRQTTRMEDIAYSMLGIFEVNMPLLYGEGSRSFARLQEEIIKELDDETIFAWKAEPNVFSGQRIQRSGILAFSPSNFRTSSRIVPVSMDLRNATFSEPVTMTNKGLRISLFLYHGRDTILGVLNCYSLDYPQGRIAIMLEGISKTTTDRRYRRISPEVLRAVPVAEAMQIHHVYISPAWMYPSAPISRFPLIDVSTNHDLGNSAYSLQKSSLVVSQDSARRLMSYTFGDGSKTMFCVKVQWLEMSETINPRIEIKVSSEVLLREWTSEFISTSSDRAETELGFDSRKVLARIDYKVGESSSRGQILNLELNVSLQ